ncbi:uncharacterized protein LOC134781365 [Penaeus indicus]|uniref:uncharacterized protein LOC134781365 n=1 Tax=Penaeus indicus TaxID=29960 RepID=UPI00300C330D
MKGRLLSLALAGKQSRYGEPTGRRMEALLLSGSPCSRNWLQRISLAFPWIKPVYVKCEALVLGHATTNREKCSPPSGEVTPHHNLSVVKQHDVRQSTVDANVYPHQRIKPSAWEAGMSAPCVQADQNLHSAGMPRKTALLDIELSKLGIDIVAFQETRLLESGSLREKNFTFFWKGKEPGENAIHGVGLAIANKIIKNADIPVGISERIITVRLTSGTVPLNIICVYTPTLTYPDAEKDAFFDHLTSVAQAVPLSESLYVIGDFNSRVGSDHASWPDCLGKHGIVSWRHPRSKHWHQLDLVLARRSDIGQVKQTRVFHSADGDTDHSLVLSTIKLGTKPRTQKKKVCRKYLDTAAMKDPICIETFHKKFTEQMDLNPITEDDSATVSWDTLQEALFEAAKSTFGIKKRADTDWLDANMDVLLPLLERKNAAHHQFKTRATHASLDLLKVARSALQKQMNYCANNYWKNLCLEIQNASDLGSFRKLYQGLKKAIGPSTRKVCPLKSSDGTMITDSNQQLARWVEHYLELYSEPRPIKKEAIEGTPSFPEAQQLDAMPTMNELIAALKSTPSGKAP